MKNQEISLPVKPKRKYLPENFTVDTWENLKPYYEDLKNRPLNSGSDLGKWLLDQSELQSVLSEECGWRYIKNSCDTTDPAAKEAYRIIIEEIQPHLSPYEDELNKRLLACPYLNDFINSLSAADRVAYDIYLRVIKKQVEIYRDENIPLYTKLRTEEQKYAEIVGAMTIDMNGQEITLPQAANYLRETNRTLREEVYVKVNERRIRDREALDTLFSDLVKMRHQIALNAGFSNYRDYMFAALSRFDYSVKDCLDFHSAISGAIVPLCDDMDRERQAEMKVQELKPWDMEVDPSGKPPLQPFDGGKELMEKAIQCFRNIHPFLGECLETMRQMKHVDLDSRKGKAPGGYNYPLYETGVPFIFMNSVNSLRDVITMVHEGGHAVHSFLTRDLKFIGFKDTPSEVSELASMSMELISMEHWDVFFEDPEELKRAKRQQLEKVISQLPWIATIDKFQHWIYTHPEHTVEERTRAWVEINGEFSGSVVNRNGQEKYFQSGWQRQLHLYQVPFYYIEYGMAQLGAIAVWRNYKKNAETGLQQYFNALKLGYTKSIGGIYETAGIRFDFSESYIRELADFVKKEMEKVS